MYLALILVFDNNQKTHEMLEAMNLFPAELRKVFNIDRRKQNG